MTILVTLKTTNKIVMGCDTRITTGGRKGYCNTKWVNLKLNQTNSCYIGITGYFKFTDFFEHGFTAPTLHDEENFEEYLHTRLAPEITKILTDRRISKTKDNILDTESEILIVYENEVYSLMWDTAPVRIRENFYATGSGADYAYGAYHAIYDNDELNAREKVTICLNAACNYDSYCGGEYVLLTQFKLGEEVNG